MTTEYIAPKISEKKRLKNLVKTSTFQTIGEAPEDIQKILRRKIEVDKIQIQAGVLMIIMSSLMLMVVQFTMPEDAVSNLFWNYWSFKNGHSLSVLGGLTTLMVCLTALLSSIVIVTSFCEILSIKTSPRKSIKNIIKKEL